MAQLANRVAVITGAGSGIGRATALALAEEGATVVLLGRRQAPLEETAALVRALGEGGDLVLPCDVAERDAVQAAMKRVVDRYGRLDILVNNAGLNVPRRSLRELSPQDWQRMLATNLDGSYWCVEAALPVMRAQGSGTCIHIGSNSAIRPSALAGAAYSVSKAGLASLSAVINAEERRNGIRSCVIVVGDAHTALLDLRPNPPPAEVRATLLQPEDVAACARLVAILPQRATLEEMVVMPTQL